MKIKVGMTDNCLKLTLEGASTFYMSWEELAKCKADFATLRDCGNLLSVTGDAIIFITAPNTRTNGTGTTTCVVAKLDTLRFFNTVTTLIDHQVITEEGKETELESDRFGFRDKPARLLGWASIIKHDSFKAQKNLAKAVKVAAAAELSNLRSLISRLIAQDKCIYNDMDELSFYFNQPIGHGYNGGIIFHRNTQSYSIHT